MAVHPNSDRALHYHDFDPRPKSAPHWRDIPPGTWVRDKSFWARRALDTHIYDILVDKQGFVYFWEDGDRHWYQQDIPDNLTVEEAKAYAAVLLRLGGPDNEY